MKNLFLFGLFALVSSTAYAADVVRVMQITGINSKGEQQELFHDRSGLLVTTEGLVNLDQVIKSKRPHQKGHYTAIQVKLANEVFRYTVGAQATRISLQQAGLNNSIQLAVDWTFPASNIALANK